MIYYLCNESDDILVPLSLFEVHRYANSQFYFVGFFFLQKAYSLDTPPVFVQSYLKQEL